MTTRPVLCGKCGTNPGSFHVNTGLSGIPDRPADKWWNVVVTCNTCQRWVGGDSIAEAFAALAKFEEKVPK